MESEQQKVLGMRKKVVDLEATLDAAAVLRSVLDVPGVLPSALIEAMSGRIIQLQTDLSKGQDSLKQAHTQVCFLGVGICDGIRTSI